MKDLNKKFNVKVTNNDGVHLRLKLHIKYSVYRLESEIPFFLFSALKIYLLNFSYSYFTE